MDDKQFLKIAIEQAQLSVKEGGFPAGAIIVKDGKIIGKGISLGIAKNNDPTGHAEITAIRDACSNLKTPDLTGTTMYESLECCTLCFSAANWAGISRIVYTCRKTSDMVEKRYYEGTIDNDVVNVSNNHKIDLVFIPDFEAESLALVAEWEKKFTE